MKLLGTKAFSINLFVTLALSAAGITGFSGIAEAATCFTCHATKGSTTDLRPVESAFRNITTGGFKGSHAKHITAPTTLASACTPCHGPEVTSTKHRNGFINVTSATSSLTYSKGTSFPQSGNPGLTLGTCSTASCHANVYGSGAVVSPVWGNAAANCTACHTTPIGANGPATGSHTTAAHEVACTTCHEAGTSATSMPSLGHGDGDIDIANVGYPLNKIKGSAAATCSTASCHVDVYGSGTVTTPVWGTSASCNSCHTVAIDATGPATGSHAAHNDSTCTDCHAAGTTSITKPGTGHLDGSITVTNGYPATAKHAAGSYSGTCSAASCHSDPYSTAFVTTPVWGTASGCAACHTGAYAITATGPATGSHAKHNTANCTDCHLDGTTATTAPTNHINNSITIRAENDYPITAKHAPGTYTGTCLTTCHSATSAAGTSPVWGTSAAACTACHPLIPTDTSHTKHVTSTTFKKALCADCHTGYVQGVTAAANHRNTTIEVDAGGYPSPKAKGTAFASCATSYCHSSGQSADGTSATPVYAAVAPTWGGSVACGSCHATTALNTGTHARHIAADNNCDYCHSGAYVSAYNSANHVNGQIDVANQGYSAGGAPGNGYGTCSTAMCHGSIAPPAWGVNTNYDTCTKCHGTGTVGPITSANRHVVAPSDPTASDTGKVSATAKIGAHQTHLQYFNGLSAQGTEDDRCQACHGPLPTSGLHVAQFGPPSDPTTTFSGLATTSAGGTMTPAYSAGSCSNTYCHNPAGINGTLASGNAGVEPAPLWTEAGYIADGTLKNDANCNKCHKSPGNPLFTSTTDHSASAMPNGIATDCAGCHGHNGGAGGVAGQQHMDGIKYGNGSCDACHGYPPMSPAKFSARVDGTYINAKVEDYTGGGGYHDAHLLTSVKASEGFTPCLPCHPSSSHNGGNGTVAKAQVNVNDAADLTFRFDESRAKRYDAASQSCSNVSCHYQPTPAWTFGL
ncbi:MAG: CxxxxCH/CxxCH domain-containing protein [Desulfuromonadaceae bacterium]|nr:CxxxxCH/CxxCH domain-containing protein [Desulfuromonadaceae bacterium]